MRRPRPASTPDLWMLPFPFSSRTGSLKAGRPLPPALAVPRAPPPLGREPRPSVCKADPLTATLRSRPLYVAFNF